ncbi:piggyBac transposable element-derived protein 3-like [Anoplophora glabripennis]|uniref:piggyBac transposable element-derived protein 3-like n=1 Tax=Anoplophora glabripennis TaxID=217634 RepID=UPI0008740883|nr:piggyBac transposable element-derived protein 3-like [Anoplophora glabripennis]
MAKRNVWKYDDLAKLTESEVDALLTEIPSDGESIDEFDDEEDVEDTPSMDIECDIDEFTATPIQNLSDSENEEDDLPLSHFVPMNKFIWKKPLMVTNTGRQENVFSESVGPANIPDEVESPVDIFCCLLNEQFIEHIVFQTNLYATQRGKTFVPTTTREIKIFLAINILMGVKRLPSYRDFWSAQMELRDSYISNLMSRRSSIRQYMPNKPIKWGYKVWTRADVHGYIDEFQIYTGKVNETAEKELGPRVITDLTRSLVGKHYFVYFDNYFTSLVLLRQLQKENIHATGTIRKKRKGIPDDFKTDKELKRGDFDWRVTDDGISCVKWMDKRIVLLGSNYENPSDTDHVVRRKKNGEMENVPCPKVLKNYNQNMGFVDKADMLKKTYQMDRKSKKWWPRIFWHFIDVSVVNAFIIFQQRCGNNRGMNLKAFRLAVVTGLVGAGKKTVKKGRARLEQKNVNNYKPTVPLEKRWDQSLHMPVYGNYRRCALCSTRDHQRRSKWACDTCGVALCLSDKKDCFQRFHKK